MFTPALRAACRTFERFPTWENLATMLTVARMDRNNGMLPDTPRIGHELQAVLRRAKIRLAN